jgi:hypothetical protein
MASSIVIGAASSVVREGEIIRSWFDDSVGSSAGQVFMPEALARDVLVSSAALFGWDPERTDLRYSQQIDGPTSHSVRFVQHFKGVPVDPAEVVVNMFKDGRVYSILNQYHYDIPEELDPGQVKITLRRAETVVARLVGDRGHRLEGSGRLIIYRYERDDNHPPTAERPAPRRSLLAAPGRRGAEAPAHEEGTYFLAWDFEVLIDEPQRDLRVLIDAMTGDVINVIDLAKYASGTSSVFDPNPVVTSGNTSLSWGSPTATLNGQRVPVMVDNLDPKDSTNNFHLDGSHVHMEEFELPTVAEPVSATGDFTFGFSDDTFLDAMAYFHIDRFQSYIQGTLGLTSVANFSIGVDPQGLQGQGDNSHYLPGTKKIAFGRRNGTAGADYNPVPDAADAMVILHEYGHAIQDNILPGFSGFSGGVGEGHGDFLAAVFYDDKHAAPANTRGIMMSFDANSTDAGWPGRRYDRATKFDEAAFTSGGGYERAEVWASAMFELYRKLGGDSVYPSVKSAARDLAIRLHLMANKQVPTSGPTVGDFALQIKAMDGALGGWRYADGLHKKVIHETFVGRHTAGFTALTSDVFINDGRKGGYGSVSGNDLFIEKLFLDNYWTTQDLWVTVAPYANNADQQNGDPGDHVEPPVGSTAYLYVRVKNKGTVGSGQVTLKAYHSDPTIGLVWPSDWTPTATPSQTVADIPAGGAYVFGPFPWTPTHVGHECVFAIAENAADPAVTQTLPPTALVSHADLVPFDNNIAQRNLYPTAAKGSMTKSFWVSNPTFERATVQLHFDSTLPEGWTFHTNLASTEAIHLAPRERRWVEVTIDQADGAEIVDFGEPPSLTISGTIGGRLIGGMSFYAAPPSAFPQAPPPPDTTSHPCGSDTVPCLGIPWRDLCVEGELELKLRFRSRDC